MQQRHDEYPDFQVRQLKNRNFKKNGQQEHLMNDENGDQCTWLELTVQEGAITTRAANKGKMLGLLKPKSLQRESRTS